jgi:hypothetical protein
MGPVRCMGPCKVYEALYRDKQPLILKCNRKLHDDITWLSVWCSLSANFQRVRIRWCNVCWHTANVVLCKTQPTVVKHIKINVRFVFSQNKFYLSRQQMLHVAAIPTVLLTHSLTQSLTHSLTHNMEHSSSWEAKRFAASQEIPSI